VRNRKRKLGAMISTEVSCPERDTVHVSVLEEQLRAPMKGQGAKRAEACPKMVQHKAEGARTLTTR
jgi:hypothetical protein